MLRRRTTQLLFQPPCWAELAGVHSMRRNTGPISVDRCRTGISADSYGRIWEERFPDSDRGLGNMCGYPDKTRLNSRQTRTSSERHSLEVGREGELVPQIFVAPPVYRAVHSEDQSTEACSLRALHHAPHHVTVVQHVHLEPARAVRCGVTYFL